MTEQEKKDVLHVLDKMPCTIMFDLWECPFKERCGRYNAAFDRGLSYCVILKNKLDREIVPKEME